MSAAPGHCGVTVDTWRADAELGVPVKAAQHDSAKQAKVVERNLASTLETFGAAADAEYDAQFCRFVA